jgi:streptogramin lyase
LGHLDPNTNTFQEWTIPTPSANPYSLAITTSGGPTELWGTEYGSDKIFTFSPVSNLLREYPLPHGDAGVGYISIEPNGPGVRVWFTETIRNANGEVIYDSTTGNATLYEDYFPAAAGGGAYGVYAQSDAVWFAGFSGIVKWTRASQQYTIWQLPVHGSAVGRFISMDSYGQLWYTQGSTYPTSPDNFVGVLHPDSTISEWRIPTPGADAREISISRESQEPWIAEQSTTASSGAIAVLSNSSSATLFSPSQTTAPSSGTPVTLAATSTVVKATNHTVTPVDAKTTGLATETFTEYPLASAPQDVVCDSQGNIWMSEPGANKIIRLSELNPDFALNTFPTSMSLSPGGSGTISVIGRSVSGYQGSPTIRALNTPSGVKFSLNSPQLAIKNGGNASSEVVINVDPNATGGTSQVTLEGNDGAITHTTSFWLTISNSSSGPTSRSPCLIATATYGSELSSEVQELRNFRDNVIKSKTGSSFLIVLNSWYYSFSPYIASYVGSHPQTTELIRSILYPLIGILALSSNLFSALAAYPEFATLSSGLFAACIASALYIGMPLGVIKRKMRSTLSMNVRVFAAVLLSGLGGISAGLALGSNVLLMIASSMTVLCAMWGSGALTADFISHPNFLKRRVNAKLDN